MITYGDNYAIERFNFKREIRVDVHDASANNIYIYIEKKFFEQHSFNVNPFDIIVNQQYYSVVPDPRESNNITYKLIQRLQYPQEVWAVEKEAVQVVETSCKF